MYQAHSSKQDKMYSQVLFFQPEQSKGEPVVIQDSPPRRSNIGLMGKDETKEIWYQWKDLYIHKQLFSYGIVAVKNNKLLNEVTCDNFSLSGREFSLHTHSEKQSSTVKKTHQLLQKLIAPKKEIVCNSSFYIVNKHRRDEIFSPLMLNKNIGLYVYPWLSTTDANFTKTAIFSGFKQFVTAGCLFGSSLKGVDQQGKAFPLIKHDIQFYPGEKIVDIMLSNEFAPYEDVLFNDLEKTACLVDTFAIDPTQKQLLYHLPYHDYILFGIELYIRGRMTRPALAEFIGYIHAKKEDHINKINEVCKKHQIIVTIESPFENLFGKVTDCSAILNLLNIPTDNTTIDAELLSEDIRKGNEKDLVQTCLMQLGSNTYNKKHAQVWKDFIKKSGYDQINNLEDLFKIANAVMVGNGASETQKYQTCSLLPVSEKQVQCNYAKYVNEVTYPSMVNLTFLDPIFTYGLGNNGLIFYCTNYETTLSELINGSNILEYAQQNIIKHINKETTVYAVKTVFDKLAEKQMQLHMQTFCYAQTLEPDSQLGTHFIFNGMLLLAVPCSFGSYQAQDKHALGDLPEKIDFNLKNTKVSKFTEPLMQSGISLFAVEKFTSQQVVDLSDQESLTKSSIQDEIKSSPTVGKNP